MSEALHLAREMAFSSAEALALHRWGMLESRGGNEDPARARLEQSRAIYHRLGARKDVEQIDQSLDTLLPPPRTPRVLLR